MGLSNGVFADTITIPNPLCAFGSGGSSPCITNFTQLISKITSYILTVIGVLAVLMFVWAGIVFVASAGNPGKIQQARDIVKWATIGLAIALAGTGLIEVIKAVIGAPPA